MGAKERNWGTIFQACLLLLPAPKGWNQSVTSSSTLSLLRAKKTKEEEEREGEEREEEQVRPAFQEAASSIPSSTLQSRGWPRLGHETMDVRANKHTEHIESEPQTHRHTDILPVSKPQESLIRKPWLWAPGDKPG